MATLITLQGPEVGRKFSLDMPTVVLGRQFDSAICLAAKAVSRQHAQILLRDGDVLVEDLESSNGTYLNGIRLSPRRPTNFTDDDTLQIGPYLFGLRRMAPTAHEPTMYIREVVSAAPLSGNFTQDPAAKLQVVLEIAQNLARTLELEPLLIKLIEQLMRLFPHADRALVILAEEDELVVRAQQGRGATSSKNIPFSRTIVRKALAEGVGLLSDDVKSDRRFQESQTITSLDLHSVLCVPLIDQQGRRLGVLQLDRYRQGVGFRTEDLQLLTVVSLQVTVALENAALHAELLVEERLRRDLAMAREIQEGYLPGEWEGSAEFALHGRVFPARMVAGDMYDFFSLPDGRVAFFIGDVSGKGMPAALFMASVRTLGRHLAKESGTPAQLLGRLNDALADDNPNCMFVTLTHGIYDPATGEVKLSSGGHPAPLLRRADGAVEQVPLRSGRLLGYMAGPLNLDEVTITLAPGETLVFFTDGMLEARAPNTRQMFGIDRIQDLVGQFGPDESLAECAEAAKIAIDTFTGSKDLQDDLTLLLLRRCEPH